MPSSCQGCISSGFPSIQTIFPVISNRGRAAVGPECILTKVSSFHVIPFALFASVYENPSTCPVLRPKRPWRLGPILLPSPSFNVWHCEHRDYPHDQPRSLAFTGHGLRTYLEEAGALLIVTYAPAVSKCGDNRIEWCLLPSNEEKLFQANRCRWAQRIILHRPLCLLWQKDGGKKESLSKDRAVKGASTPKQPQPHVPGLKPSLPISKGNLKTCEM